MLSHFKKEKTFFLQFIYGMIVFKNRNSREEKE